VLDAIVVTMYTYTVDRTQIYLTPDENAALERESIKTGKTKSQLIREAIDEKYGTRRSLEEFMAALNGAFGLWANPEGEAAVKAIHAGRRAEARQTRRRLKALQALTPDDWNAALDDATRR
jgi:predicted DNA-binding protein